MQKEASAPPLIAPVATAAAPPLAGTEAILCAIRGTGRTLEFALREAKETGRRLYLLFVREQLFMTEQDTKRKWQEDPEASQIFATARRKPAGSQPSVLLCCQCLGGGDNCGYRGHARGVAGDFGCATAKRIGQYFAGEFGP